MKHPDDFTAESIRDLRLSLKLSQTDFWNAIGVSKQKGCNIERGAVATIAPPVRLLLFLRYVLNIPVDDLSALRRRLDGLNSINEQLAELRAAVARLEARTTHDDED